MNKNPITIPRGQISILAGASGAGKTTLLMQAIAFASKGLTFLPEFTWEGEPSGGIAYVAADRPIREVLELAQRLGVREDKIEFYSIADDKTLSGQLLTSPTLLFKNVVNKFKNPFDLLVIDPIGLFIDGSINNYHQVARSLIPMNQMATERDITILATHHARKARLDVRFARPQDRIAGSTAFLGYSGTQMVLVPAKEEDGTVREDRLFVIPHTMAEMTVYLMRGQDGLLHRVETGVPATNVAPFPKQKT